MTPYTLSYTILGEALQSQLQVARLQKADKTVVEASVTSIEFAMMQFGMGFGNNGDASGMGLRSLLSL